MNKFNKGKLIGVVAASLSTVSLMGVGFASWIINGTTPANVGNINVEVGTVDDQRIKVVVGSPAIEGQLSFDAAQDSENKITSNKNNEFLSFSVNYMVEVAKGFTNFKVDATWTPGDKMSEFLGKNYITSPFREKTVDKNLTIVSGVTAQGKAESTDPTTHITTPGFHTDAPTASPSDGATTYTCKTTFYFGWGTTFNSKNPVYESSSSLDADGIVNALKELQSLNNETFTITLTPSVVTTSGI